MAPDIQLIKYLSSRFQIIKSSNYRIIKLFFLFSYYLITLFPFSISAQPQHSYTSGEIQLALKKLSVIGSVLYIAAHPDDENTRLLSYLVNERCVRAAYLSVTRGDGGQNLIGTEQSELLGLIRTQELLAARKIDGAEQFFTRANDFGFSKTADETMKIWGKEEVLYDMVWVIRKFRPDVIITRFPATGEGGHGHHTASAILAAEAFDAAADPKRFPEQLKYVSTWQAKRLLWNNFLPSRDSKTDTTGLIRMNIGTYNPLLGKSYGELAAESRSMHKSQGFGSARNRGPVIEFFRLLKGDSATTDILENMDLSWNRIPESKHIAELIQKAYRQFDPEKPELIVPLLADAYSELSKLKSEPWTDHKKKELEELIIACSGLWFEATASEFSGVPVGEIKINASIVKRSALALRLEQLKFPFGFDTLTQAQLSTGQIFTVEKTGRIPNTDRFSNPYWLNEKHGDGIYKVRREDSLLIGKPENDPELKVTFVFSHGSQRFTWTRPVVHKWTDPVEGERYRPFEIIPPVTLNFSSGACLFPNSQPKKIELTLKAGGPGYTGTLVLVLPSGWKADREAVEVNLKTKGEEQKFTFLITPSSSASAGILKAFVTGHDHIGYSKSITRIEHKHIPHQVLFTPAEIKLVPVVLEKKGKIIGYIPGAGDEIPEALSQAGYTIAVLDDEILPGAELKIYDAIVVGIRAYNTNDRMEIYRNKLMDYVKNGGTMVVQYNTNNFLGGIKSEIGPYPFKIGRERVTVEEATMVFTDAAHPLLNTPNKITAKDFEGWIQERGIYFASEWDSTYNTVFICNDPGEKPSKGSTLTAKYGNGYFIYTGLAFFRQLPAGVPGAYRLFVNMVSLGK